MTEGLVLLVLLWAVLLVPSALRSRTSSSPHVTVGGFERAMDVLRTSPHGNAVGRQLMVPADASRIVGRAEPVDRAAEAAPRYQRIRHEDPRIASRRTWFLRLLAGTGVSLLLAVIVGGVVWVAAFLAIAATVGYATLLRRLKLQRDEVRTVVRSLELESERRAPVSAAVGHDVPPTGSVRLRRWDG